MNPDRFWEDKFPGDDIKARSVRGASITALVQVPKVLLMFASQLILARLLLPGDFGLVAEVTPVIGFVQVVGDLGLTQAVVSRPRLRLSELNGFFWIILGLSSCLALVAGLSGPLLAMFYGEPRVMAVTFASAPLIVVGSAGMVQAALLNRQMRFGALALVEVSSLAVSVIGSAMLAWHGWGYWSLVLAQAGASFTATGLYWLLSSWRPSMPLLDRGALSLARFGGNITISNLANYLNTTVDNVMIGAALGRVVLGLYDRAWKLAVQPLSQIQAPFHRVSIPALSRLVDDPRRYRQAFLYMTQAMILLVAPAMIFASLLASPLISFVLGERWLPAAPIFAWLCLGAAITPINTSTLWLLISQGRAREQMVFGTAAATINMLAYACGLPWGIVYVAAVSTISVYLIQSPMLVWVSTRQGPVGRVEMARLLAPNLVAAVATAFALEGARRLFVIADVGSLLLAAVGVLGVYVAVLACFPSSRILLRNLSTIHRVMRPTTQAGPEA
jgi:polysaccharide transporter, PST family